MSSSSNIEKNPENIQDPANPKEDEPKTEKINDNETIDIKKNEIQDSSTLKKTQLLKEFLMSSPQKIAEKSKLDMNDFSGNYQNAFEKVI